MAASMSAFMGRSELQTYDTYTNLRQLRVLYTVC
jgi:hypothetical protein